MRKDLDELGLDNGLTGIKEKSKMSFKKVVKKQTKELALLRLLQKKEGHSKMINLEYTDLEMQEYLKDNQLTSNQAKVVFCFRTRMAKFSENFKGGKPTKVCPVCETTTDTQMHSFQCKVLSENLKIAGKYTDIFTPRIGKNLAETLERILKMRETYLEN